MLALFIASPCLAQATQPASSPAVTSRVDALLTQMEKSGAAVNDLQTKVTYVVAEPAVGSIETRKGSLSVLRSAPDAQGRRAGKFLVQFDTVLMEDSFEADKKVYIFDGEVLTIARYKTKTATRERMVEAGQMADPFRLDGPFPVPFGDKKDSLLARFEISQTPPAFVKALPKGYAPENALWLIPKPDTKLAKDMSAMLLIIDPANGLPRLIRTYDPQYATNQSFKEATFQNLQINPGLPAGTFTLEIPKDFHFQDASEKK